MTRKAPLSTLEALLCPHEVSEAHLPAFSELRGKLEAALRALPPEALARLEELEERHLLLGSTSAEFSQALRALPEACSDSGALYVQARAVSAFMGALARHGAPKRPANPPPPLTPWSYPDVAAALAG